MIESRTPLPSCRLEPVEVKDYAVSWRRHETVSFQVQTPVGTFTRVGAL